MMDEEREETRVLRDAISRAVLSKQDEWATHAMLLVISGHVEESGF